MQKFRPNTIDHLIYGMIFHVNEYHLPEAFQANDIILDIGTHAGYFAEAALRRGAGKVVGFEVNPENYALAKQNLQAYEAEGRVDIRQAAVWRSDVVNEILFQHHFEEATNQKLINTGNSFVSSKRGAFQVDAIGLDALLMELSEQETKRIRMLKIDCEGGEWPILLTSKKLHLIDEIHGEYHEPNLPLPFDDFQHIGANYKHELLQEYLKKAGFQVLVKPVNQHQEAKWKGMGMFYASRIQDPALFEEITLEQIAF